MTTPYQIIDAKKRGRELSGNDISFMVESYVSGSVSDAQMAAFLMAVCLNGMSMEECTALTMAMAESGEVLDMSAFPDLMDKHSTGGVGDKTTFLVGPMVAALGYPVGMMSGRGLGHTGGTLDKLESIRGFRCSLSAGEYRETISECGLSIISQTAELAPADARMYALRDLTATVDSLPLIASSIISKKVASGTRNIVLDVKYGSGAFLPDKGDASKLAQTMESIARGCGINAKACLSDAGDVLGCYAGNAVEIEECLDILSGRVSPLNEGLVGLSVDLASELVMMAEPDASLGDIRRRLRATLDDGSALEKFSGMCRCQGAVLSDGLPVVDFLPDREVAIRAERAGVVSSVDARGVGLAIVELGGGRVFAGDAVFHDVGVRVGVHRGDRIGWGEPLAWVCYRGDASGRREGFSGLLDGVVETLAECWEIS